MEETSRKRVDPAPGGRASTTAAGAGSPPLPGDPLDPLNGELRPHELKRVADKAQFLSWVQSLKDPPRQVVALEPFVKPEGILDFEEAVPLVEPAESPAAPAGESAATEPALSAAAAEDDLPADEYVAPDGYVPAEEYIPAGEYAPAEEPPRTEARAPAEAGPPIEACAPAEEPALPLPTPSAAPAEERAPARKAEDRPERKKDKLRRRRPLWKKNGDLTVGDIIETFRVSVKGH